MLNSSPVVSGPSVGRADLPPPACGVCVFGGRVEDRGSKSCKATLKLWSTHCGHMAPPCVQAQNCRCCWGSRGPGPRTGDPGACRHSHVTSLLSVCSHYVRLVLAL